MAEPVDAPQIRIEPRVTTRRSEEKIPPPRLSIAHLYLWVTCCAVHLALVRTLLPSDQPGVIGVALVSLEAMIAGAAWAGLVIFLTRRWRRSRWPIEPGEWLLAALGVHFAVEMMLTGRLGRAFAAPSAIVAAATACVLVLPTFTRLPARWRIAFYVLLALQCAPLAMLAAIVFGIRVYGWAEFTVKLPLLATVVNIAALGVVAYRDRVAAARHTWLHWLGLGTWLLVLGVAPVLFWFVTRL